MKKTIKAIVLVFLAVEAGMLWGAGLMVWADPHFDSEEVYRCQDDVLLQRYSMAQADLRWWGPFPLYRTTRDLTLSSWIITDKECA